MPKCTQERPPNSRSWRSSWQEFLGMMELQQQCQEQLAREQQQRQEKQFGRLLEEQQQQGKLLMKQQREAEEQMGTLKLR